MPDTIELAFEVNWRSQALRIEPRELLADVLRLRLGLTGLKVSCDIQVCGACTVLVDGLAVSACTYLAADADGRSVTTVEGLATDGRLTRVQQAFIDHAAFQCGFCTPGMIMQAAWLLDQNPSPSEREIREGIAGNLCRCTGYVNIVKAIQQAAGELSAAESAPVVAAATTEGQAVTAEPAAAS